MIMKRNVLIDDPNQMYTLVENEDGSLCLEVVCGGVAMELGTMPLNDDEVRQYQEEGKTYLDDLAYRAARREGDYRTRLEMK